MDSRFWWILGCSLDVKNTCLFASKINHVWVMGERNAEIFKNRGLGAESLIFQVENEPEVLHQLLGTGKPYNLNRLLCMDWRISPSISLLCELCLLC